MVLSPPSGFPLRLIFELRAHDLQIGIKGGAHLCTLSQIVLQLFDLQICKRATVGGLECDS